MKTLLPHLIQMRMLITATAGVLGVLLIMKRILTAQLMIQMRMLITPTAGVLGVLLIMKRILKAQVTETPVQKIMITVAYLITLVT